MTHIAHPFLVYSIRKISYLFIFKNKYFKSIWWVAHNHEVACSIPTRSFRFFRININQKFLTSTCGWWWVSGIKPGEDELGIGLDLAGLQELGQMIKITKIGAAATHYIAYVHKFTLILVIFCYKIWKLNIFMNKKTSI